MKYLPPDTVLMVLLFAVLALPARVSAEIYFGDLHTHTNLSGDAVLGQIIQGVDRGPETVCTYARACAAVDFFGLSDHAEMVDAEGWRRTQEAVKSCNLAGAAVVPPGADPEIVALTGFEWTGSAASGGKYWGHKNVFFRNDTVPEMPVGANVVSELGIVELQPLINVLLAMKEYEVGIRRGIHNLAAGMKVAKLPRCNADNEPQPCARVANTPEGLFGILNRYRTDPQFVLAGYDALVIPHGTAWGMAKVGTEWDIQLNRTQHDPELQRLIEVFSGHGNSEEYRDFTRPGSGYESCQLRAGRLAWKHCTDGGGAAQSCSAEAQQAAQTTRVNFPTAPADWGQCGECPDCFQPAERYQPQGSVQAALALSGFDKGISDPIRYHFGFIGSTDDHSGRPASVMERRRLTDWSMGRVFPASVDSAFAPKGRNAIEAERVGSFFYPGGLVAVHAPSRSREEIWQSLKRREVYGTSGPRIKLWFRAVAGANTVPMGSAMATGTSPLFTVEAWGGPTEMDGCSPATRTRWGEELLHNVCLDVCFNPGPRVGIDRLEIVRIRPQVSPDEPIGSLIDDPWKVIVNPDRDTQGKPSSVLKAQFRDEEYGALGRDALYYVRVLQEPTAAVNGVPMQRSASGWKLCPPDYAGEDCRSMTQERAWSSPIYLHQR